MTETERHTDKETQEREAVSQSHLMSPPLRINPVRLPYRGGRCAAKPLKRFEKVKRVLLEEKKKTNRGREVVKSRVFLDKVFGHPLFLQYKYLVNIYFRVIQVI